VHTRSAVNWAAGVNALGVHRDRRYRCEDDHAMAQYKYLELEPRLGLDATTSGRAAAST